MKKIIVVLSLILFSSMAIEAFAADIEMATSVRYDWFTADNDDTGSQFLLPVQLRWHNGNTSMALTTAFVSTEYDPDEGESRSLDGLIDTRASIGYQLIDSLPFDLLFGLDINIPTGQTKLKDDEIALTTSDDLYTVSSFGEGWNINPTLVIVKNWDRFSAGVGLGYAFRGEYDFSTKVLEYDPGDKLTATAELNYDLTEEWLGRLFIEYSAYGNDQVEGDDYFKEGDFALLGFSLQYLADGWDAALTARAVSRGKAEIQGIAGKLKAEDEKSIGNEFLVDLFYRYLFGKTTLKTLLQLQLTNENDYAEAASAYTDKKQKVSLSIGLSRPLTDSLSGEINLKGFMLDEGKKPGGSNEDVTYTGASLAILLSGRF